MVPAYAPVPGKVLHFLALWGSVASGVDAAAESQGGVACSKTLARLRGR